MNNLLKRITTPSPSLIARQARDQSDQSPILIRKLLYLLTWMPVVLALVAGIVLLVADTALSVLPHAPISAAPLLLVGAAYLGFQALTRPKPLDLFKALIVSSAFILWGIDQLLPSGWGATLLGDVVITLYVLDLGWMMIDRLKQGGILDRDKVS